MAWVGKGDKIGLKYAVGTFDWKMLEAMYKLYKEVRYPLVRWLSIECLLNTTLSTVIYLLMKENNAGDMENKEFLESNFPACMKKEELIAKLSESQGVVERKSRRDLVNELETLLLFSFRGERRMAFFIYL